MRVFNFSAGPAVLPESVLVEAAAEMLDWHGSGMSVMEMSHRGAEFGAIIAAAERDLRALLSIPAGYRVLFMQGGALAQNALVPLNLLGEGQVADYVDTGSWSQKSIREARRYGTVAVIASAEKNGYTAIPPEAEWAPTPRAAYRHICTNETIGGLEYQWLPAPDRDTPLVADMSSDILSRPLEVSRFGLIYAGAQKNIGPAGLTLVIVREDLLGRAHPLCPSVFNYATVAEAGSMTNTPPTYAIYIAGLVFRWLLAQADGQRSALEVVGARNRAKAAAVYDALDEGFYVTRVAKSDRSQMNVPFFLPDPRLDGPFLEGAKAAGLIQLKGHKSVGGMRASLYNAMPVAGAEALARYLRSFAARHG